METVHAPICRCGCQKAIARNPEESRTRWQRRKFVNKEHARKYQRDNKLGWFATAK